jgi:ubiquinone/menaquinone biosynthesis C-methylase UbiE
VPVEASLPAGSTFEHGRNRVSHRLLVGREVGQLLDYGCGNAEFALAIKRELGIGVHACDIDGELIERLREAHGDEVDFFTVSDTDPKLSLGDGQVSAVTCCDVLEHMPEPLRLAALEEMRRVLADDGALIVTTPHKGIFSALDPENAKYYFPRAHRLIFTALKGKEKYRLRYGGERFGNFSAGAMRHVHFSAAELSEILHASGFEVDEVRYFTLIYPFIKTLLWFAESLAGRVWGADRLTALCWKVYIWDADLEPGRLAGSIGIRAVKRAR